MTTILLTALEASGDALGAGLMIELRRRLGPDVRFIGLGGPAMAAQGLVSAFDIAELSVFGLLDGLLAVRRAQRRADQIADLARREQPDIAVMIDSWGFSYLLARVARAAGPPQGVLAKLPKPGQDRRVDLPTIGVRTIERAAAAGLKGVVGEAGGLLMVDPNAVREAADRLGVFVFGLETP